MELGERKQKVLGVIVELYVKNGEPVGSKKVCAVLDNSFSSATIRNDMAELDELGFLEQPHTSAGRIPSHKGYRFYINRLMNKKPMSFDEKSFISGVLCRSSDDPENLIKSASQMLADITKFTAIFTTPANDEAKVRNIQFVQTGKRNAMMVLMTTTGMINNKLFRCDYDLTPELLCIFRKILIETFKNKPLSRITLKDFSTLTQNNSEIIKLMSPVITAVIEAASEAKEIKIETSGEKNLLKNPDICIDKAINILEFLEGKENVLDLILSNSGGVKVLVGKEIGNPALENSSVIVTNYNIGDRSGTIGVIGTTRMDYAKLTASLEYLASEVEIILKKILNVD